ncbi:MAG: adenylosuccinate synthetase [Cyanobium sp. MAG06]|nr:adenylosuccinate synthetase [Cyanobium sp. MAG06]
MNNHSISIKDTKLNGRIVSILGLQYGDEGKGKVSDSIIKNINREDYIIVAPNGGGNAGHTIVVFDNIKNEKVKLALHELPGGAFNAKYTFLSQARIIKIENLIKEITEIESYNKMDRKFFIANRAILNISGIYNIIEAVAEDSKATDNLKVGTTKQGIGPSYSAEALRLAITISQLINLNEDQLYEKIKEIKAVFTYINQEEVFEKIKEIKSLIIPFLKSGQVELVSDDFLTQEFANEKYLIIEGSQSVSLGKFGGQYPYNTSSDCSLNGILSASLLPKTDIFIGVLKAVISKVGGGRFANELSINGVSEDFVNNYREKAGEYGATTKRPRQLGFFDIVQLKHTFKTNGIPDLL